MKEGEGGGRRRRKRRGRRRKDRKKMKEEEEKGEKKTKEGEGGGAEEDGGGVGGGRGVGVSATSGTPAGVSHRVSHPHLPRTHLLFVSSARVRCCSHPHTCASCRG